MLMFSVSENEVMGHLGHMYIVKCLPIYHLLNMNVVQQWNTKQRLFPSGTCCGVNTSCNTESFSVAVAEVGSTRVLC